MTGVKDNLNLLKNRAEKEINSAHDLKELDEVFKKYLGKRGELTHILRSLKNLPPAQRKKQGKEANDIKNHLRVQFDKKVREVQERIKREAEEKEWIDVTAPGKKISVGHLHPLTLVRRKV